MSSARVSIMTWGVYTVAIGVAMFLLADVFTDLLGLDRTREVWIRVLGVMLLLLASFYIGSAIHNARWLHWYSVIGRILVAVGLGFLAVNEGMWQLWLLAILDILGAGWTYMALRHKDLPPQPESLAETG